MAKDTKKGLGRGLSELFGDDILDNENEGELIYAPIAKVEPRAEQPRNRFDYDALQELADSIAQYGLIQPITVRRREGGFYQIIAGERRWRACRMAGLVEVPVRVIEADDRRVAELALVENLQREDLNPIEEALGYKSLIEEYGLTQEEASKSVGRSRPAIANAMRLLSLSKEVLPLVEDGTLSAGHARALLPISDPAEQLKAARAVRAACCKNAQKARRGAGSRVQNRRAYGRLHSRDRGLPQPVACAQGRARAKAQGRQDNIGIL